MEEKLAMARIIVRDYHGTELQSIKTPGQSVYGTGKRKPGQVRLLGLTAELPRNQQRHGTQLQVHYEWGSDSRVGTFISPPMGGTVDIGFEERE